MIISQTSQYALRAMVFLSQQGSGELVKVKAVSEKMQVPQNYLSKIFHTLSRHGILESSPGKKGGFQLAHPAEELLLTEIVRPFESSDFPKICILGQTVCSDDKPCSAHSKWKKTAEKIRYFFDTTTLHELSKRKDKEIFTHI